MQGVSAIDRREQPFEDIEARKALFDAVRSGSQAVPVIELDHHINDPEFSLAAARQLIEMMK